MSKDPAFLFYHHDFLVGTNFMTHEEVGCYIRILCYLADKQRLSYDQVKQICDSEDLAKSMIDKLEQDDEGFFFNRRLRDEVHKRQAYSQSRRENRLSLPTPPPVKIVEVKKEEKVKHLEFVLLKADEYEKLNQRFGKKVVDIQIQNLNNYIGSKGKKYKSHYHTILTWFNKNGVPEQSKKGTPIVEESTEEKIRRWKREQEAGE